MRGTMRKFLLLFTVLAVMLTSCNLPARPTSAPGIDQAQAGTIVAMTLSALHSPTPNNLINVINSPIPSITTTPPAPEITGTPTLTITPPYSQPFFSFSENINCREGPGIQYRVITLIRAGQQATGVGVQGTYWIVNNPNGDGTCWIPNEFSTPSGSTWELPTVSSPPTITGVPLAAPTWSNWEYFCTATSGNTTMTMTLKWTDHAQNETGYKVYRNGELVTTLGPDANTYVDNAAVSAGKELIYAIEVFNETSHVSGTTINASCQ